MISSIFQHVNKFSEQAIENNKKLKLARFEKLLKKSDVELLRILKETYLLPYSQEQQRYQMDLLFSKSDNQRMVVEDNLKQTLLAKNESDFGEHDSEAYMARQILRERNFK
jgi:hypothetical protein